MSADSDDENVNDQLEIHDDATEVIDTPRHKESNISETKDLLFKDIIVKVVGSVIRLDKNNSAYTCYLVAVLYNGDERWRIEKRFSNFLNLDEKFKKENIEYSSQVPKLPEKTIINRLSPAVIDERKLGLQNYLQKIIQLTPDWQKLIEFLTTDIKLSPNRSRSSFLGGQMEGYLSKKGKKLGIWTPRYYVFRGGYLMYYKNGRDKDGKPDGVIGLDNTSVAALQGDLQHGFILTEGAQQHLLYAENDRDRDDWVQILSVHIEMMKPVGGESKKIYKTQSTPTESGLDGFSNFFSSYSSFYSTQKAQVSIFRGEPKKEGPRRHSSEDRKYDQKIIGLDSFFKKKETKKGEEKFKIFGVSPKEGDPIPPLITKCIQYVEQKGLKDEGIYRISGQIIEVNELKESFEEGTERDPSSWNYSVHTVTTILKIYLRELPEPLHTEKLKMIFYDIGNVNDKEKQMKQIVSLFTYLPSPNSDILLALMDHFKNVIANESVNKMGLRNLCIAFGNILEMPTSVFSTLVTDLEKINQAIKSKKSENVTRQELLSDIIDSDDETKRSSISSASIKFRVNEEQEIS